MMDYSTKFADRAIHLSQSPIAKALNLLSRRPDVISFAAGTPDSELLPTEILGHLTTRAINDHGKTILQYGHMQGFLPLRETLVEWLATERGVTCTSDAINITTGASGAINSLCTAFLNKGDRVLVESPTYSLALEAFTTFEADIAAVESDEAGMIPEALEARLKEGEVKYIYILPTFQNPTGRTMSIERRRAVAALAQQYDTLVIEDDIYSDLRYEGDRLPPIHSFAPDHTIYISSVSKLFAPAMRIGIMVAPPQIMERIILLKPSLDLQASVFTQAVTNVFLQDGHAKEHMAKVKESYSRKLIAMQDALRDSMPKEFTWNKPEGGMFVWVSGPDGFNSDVLLDKAIDRGVAFIPGSSFYVEPNKERRHMRLSFVTPSERQIYEGAATLGELVR